MGSLSFSVWDSQQILVASEMRIPEQLRGAVRVLDDEDTQQMVQTMSTAHPAEISATTGLPEAGVTRGIRPMKREIQRLYEDVIGFEGRLCVFSLTHTTTADLSE